jgi:4-amino-4-deoxy-L-arabinose transferase-like glycosyltransferase
MSTSEYPAERAWAPRLRDLRTAVSLSAEGWMTVGLVVLAAVIRILVINNQSFWADEALTAFEARLPFGAMIHTVLHVETTPPLYFVLVWGWRHAFGSGTVALRSISTLAGIAVVPIAYLCGRELASRRAGVIAAAFVAFNPFLIWYSQEARAYMLLVALCGASFLWFARARRAPTRRNLAWWAVWSGLALMTHFFAGFLVALEAVWLLWVARTRVAAAAVAVAVVAIVEVAMLPFALIDTGHGAGWIAAIPQKNRIANAIAEWGVSILFRQTSVTEALLGGAAVVIVAVLLTIFGGDRRTRDAVITGAVAGGFVWVAPLLLSHVGQDYFLSRNVMPAVVPLAVALGAACAAPRTRWLGGGVAAALLAMFAVAAVRVQTHPYLERPNWRAVAHALGPATVPRAILAADGTTADPLKIYLPRVQWTEPDAKRMWIREVDVVGATKALPLLPVRLTGPRALLEGSVVYPSGSSVPRSVAAPGTRLAGRFRVQNWVLGRLAFRHPMRLSIDQLKTMAPRFFRRTPLALLVFFQPPSRS